MSLYVDNLTGEDVTQIERDLELNKNFSLNELQTQNNICSKGQVFE